MAAVRHLVIVVHTTTAVTVIPTVSAVITCSDSWAARGERNVFVSCEVRAKPQVDRLHWIIDDNGTTVSEGQIVDEYWTLVMVCSDLFRRDGPDMFTYFMPVNTLECRDNYNAINDMKVVHWPLMDGLLHLVQ